jgi:hypothetical protein
MSDTIAGNSNLALGLQSDPGVIPLILGIVGHRDPDPESVPEIARQFEFILKSIIDKCPNTPIWMLNGLAAGMDTIAAEVFLNTVRQQTNRESHSSETPIDKLYAVLPKNPREYANDFDSAEQRSLLEKLLKRSDAVISPETTSALRTGSENITNEPECYALQGGFIAKYSYILVAFYDGKDNGLLGGTSQTLAIHKGENHPLFHSTEEILSSREPGISIIIETPRLSSGIRPKNQRIGREQISIPEKFVKTCKYLESINSAIRKKSYKPVRYDEIEGSYTRVWSHADKMAGKHKEKYELIAVLLVTVGFLLVTTAELSGQKSALGWGLVFVAFAWFPRIQKKLQKPFLTNRCLAESLTIQYIWSGLGIEIDVADLLLSQGQEELNQIRVILRSVAFQLDENKRSHSLDIENKLTKTHIWMQGQIVFLTRRIKLYQELVIRWRRVGYIMAASALVSASMQLLPVQIDWLSSIVPVLLAGFASSFAYQELMGYEQTCERYEVSISKFKRASEALHYLDGADCQYSEEMVDPLYRHKLIIKAIGEEKIDELNEWMANQLEKTYQPG